MGFKSQKYIGRYRLYARLTTYILMEKTKEQRFVFIFIFKGFRKRGESLLTAICGYLFHRKVIPI